MMKGAVRILLFYVLCLSAFTLSSQQNYYWVKFTDKQTDGYSINDPSQFLSLPAIERRTKQHIAIDSTDLPITQNYIDSIRPFIIQLKHRLKWFNMIVVQLPDSSFVDSIKRFAFVDTMNRIEKSPARALNKSNKFESPTPADQQYVYGNEYGIAYDQTKMLNVDLLHQTGSRGRGVIISVMDNGFLNVNSIAGFDSVRSRILTTWDFVHNSPNVYTDGGHGTSTFSCMAAEIPSQILGTAPDASYILSQTEDNSAEWVMEEYNWAAAAEWADSLGADIFSTSLGYTDFDDNIGNHNYSDLDGKTTIIARAGDVAFSKGILVVNSAGNEGDNSWHYISTPADGDSVLAVGAVDATGKIADFSGRGPTPDGRIKPDVCAQGVRCGVLTTTGELGYNSGTSFSCPIIAGSAASLWSAFPNKTAQEIYSAILLSCPTYRQPNNNYGYGIPNFYTAYWLLKSEQAGYYLQASDDITFYPNPFTSNLNLTISLYGGDNDNWHTLEVFDMMGRNVFSKKMFIRNHTFEVLHYPELENLAAGQYVLRFDGDKSKNHLLIKSR